MLASDELRRRKGLHSRQFNLTARKIAEFIESLEGEELSLMQRLKDRENRKVLDAIDDQEKNIVGSDEEALVSNDEQQMAASDQPVRHGRRSAKARASKKEVSTRKDTAPLESYGRF